MSKQDFFLEAEKRGFDTQRINELYNLFLLLIKEMPETTIQLFLDNAVEAQAEEEKYKKTGEYPLGSWWFDEFLKKRKT